MSEAEYIIEDLKGILTQLKICSDDVLTYIYKIKYKLNTRSKSVIFNEISKLYECIASIEIYVDILEDQI